MKGLYFCHKLIIYSFYAIFLLTPLIFFGNTSELFEFNKMWLLFGLTVIISACWFTKMVISKTFLLKKTPFDIFLFIFLITQFISTIISLDPRVSFWGYYTRFNGGLLSTMTYIFLYYAAFSNLEINHVKKIIKISLISGLITALWGFPSHFGYDPTCFVFRGEFDTSCWTDAFKPTIRVFSTLGQPAWLAAFMGVLFPLSLSFWLIRVSKNKKYSAPLYLCLSVLFYLLIIFSNTRAGFIAFYFADLFFWSFIFLKQILNINNFLKYFFIFHVLLLLCNFFYGAPIGALNKFTWPEIQKKLVVYAQTQSEESTSSPNAKADQRQIDVTDSSNIRLLVWRGAIDAWRANPLFGTGVETFAFAYYKHRPPEHNLTSEWDYLYNKAHNEYLNYATTSGSLGILAYLSFIFAFLYFAIKSLYQAEKKDPEKFLMLLGILSGFLTVLITNFFGFSVVVINLFLFLLPTFFIKIKNNAHIQSTNYTHSKNSKISEINISNFQWLLISLIIIIAGYFLLGLFRYWYADTQYALGANLDRSSNYQQAYPLLNSAVSIIPDEPVYKDELAINLGTIAAALYSQKDKDAAAQAAQASINISNEIVQNHPNNLIFWKNRLRIFYNLAGSDTQNQTLYLNQSIQALQKSVELAPTDAKLYYNLGVLYGQMNRLPEGISALEKAIKLKPNYFDAYSALGLLYRKLAVGNSDLKLSNTKQINKKWQKKAIEAYRYVLKNLSPDNKQIKEYLQEWEQEGDF